MKRRDLLEAMFAAPFAWGAERLACTAAATSVLTAVTASAKGASPQVFDYAWLKGRARELAGAPYIAPDVSLPPALTGLDYTRFQALRFKADHSLWADAGLPFQLQFFHRGYTYRERVRIYEVVDGQAREVEYDPAAFDLKGAGVDGSTLPRDLGFAGFRIHFHTDFERDVAAFLGASYFRAVGGDTRQFGLSARGLAVDTGSDRGEEFPRFTTFWFEQPKPGAQVLTLYALLDSPSVTGAYRFDMRPGGTLTTEVDAAAYPRKAIERVGIAPLTSMFLVGSSDRRVNGDWRGEIHDSDGLSMHTGAGEWLWRPLSNPAGVHLYTYVDQDPRGFGLLQRDRAFDHYQDDGVFYDRRPSVWVEPKASWGRGGVQLLELPAPNETFDNIVAYWMPEASPQPGQELLYSYRLYWGENVPLAVPPLAQVVATRSGIGGVVGHARQGFSWRFVIDFAGGEVATLGKGVQVEPLISASRGTIEIPSARPLDVVRGYRAIFDIRPPDASIEPIDLRLQLRVDGQPVSETWLFQWVPPSLAERKRLVELG
jgi:glucans biosynthesis protein